jgi:DNA primase
MGRIDTDALKRDHPVEGVIASYGIELRQSGRTLLGRCPFHDDGGRPNLYVYPGTQSWYCYRCSVGGDVISFVQRIEGVGFCDAVERLTGGQTVAPKATKRLIRRTKSRASHRIAWGPDERACLAAAVELYHNRLLTDPAPLAYLHGRGLNRDVIDGCRLGYAAGDELAAYLRWRRLPVQAAVRVGLLGRGGREFLAGRVVVPEMRDGQPIWLVGRTIHPLGDGPKYLGLPGHKPLLGWEVAKDSPEVFLVEGVFDWLALLSWGYPALALVGTHVPRAALKDLGRFERVFLVLDNDEVGRAAAHDLSQALSNPAVIVTLPGVKDVAELATAPDGRHIFSRAVGEYDPARAA